MVMPLYRGMTLKQARTRMQTPPSEAWLRKVLWSVLGALKVLHRGHALHRDVSPDNIFLQDIGPPVLLDLGAARVAINDNSKEHTAILKVNFAPIEQYADVRGMPQGPWTDLYSLAAVVHCMLCNEAPTPATIRAVNDSLLSFESIAKTVETQFGLSYSESFVAAIDAALSIRPEDRPQSVQLFARALGLTTPNGMSSFDCVVSWARPACQPASCLARRPVTQVKVLCRQVPAMTTCQPNSSNPRRKTTTISMKETIHPPSLSRGSRWSHPIYPSHNQSNSALNKKKCVSERQVFGRRKTTEYFCLLRRLPWRNPWLLRLRRIVDPTSLG
jgi:serine/threonine protein kinase